MQFKENAEVLTSDGRKLGRIDRVVINPESKEITHLVVKKGLLFTKDKVIPVDQIETATEDDVVLKIGAGDPDEMPDFEETQHIPVHDVPGLRRKAQPGYARPIAWYYARPGVGWWGLGGYPDYSKPSYVARIERNIPDDAIPLEEGAKVVSSEGDHVGDIERIFTEPKENRATHLLISQGLLFKEKKLIPTLWVKGILEEKVQLSVEKDFVERLPAYRSSD
jgi:uncharacterized protein YrrD